MLRNQSTYRGNAHYRGAQEWRLVYHGLSQNVGPSDLALLLLEGEGAI